MKEEWKRTNPDLVVYLPKGIDGPDHTNQHFNVVATPSGTFLATWTSGTREAAPDQRVVFSRSTDRGKTWSEPEVLDGAKPNDPPGTGMASWQFPIICPGVLPGGSTRIWCFYNKNIGIDDARAADTGVCRGRYSDDDGITWCEKTYDIPIEPNAISHPDPKVPPTWIVYQTPTVTPEGAVLAGFTRWASNAVDPNVGMFERASEVCFLRFENILTEADPDKLVVTTWPKTPHGLSAPNPFRPGINTAQEPTNPSLSDGRLICVMRTLLGRIYFALSEDDGRTWDEPRPLLYEPGGQPLLNPMAPCPLYKLKDGRFLLVYFNNDGSGHGGSGPTDSRNVRNPAWITIGREIPGEKKQPIRFGKPKVFASTDWTPISGTDTGTQVATYTSLVEDKGERILFYPDRKHFLLAKYLTDEWLADCDPDVVGVGP
ncbi:MAG: exo-alpha-sialidase [Armatimonadetes bacterium]|nr:exo-alpha-sialidase [Armatimonadota bacterium]